MIVLHALWTSARLHLWAERGPGALPTPRSTTLSTPTDAPAARLHPQALPAESLRRIVGDRWDGLLASGASDDRLDLHLPTIGETPELSPRLREDKHDSDDAIARELVGWQVPTLAFTPAEALDVLTALPAEDTDLTIADSLHYWAHLGNLVLTLLAGQRFVPDVVETEQGYSLGRWRSVLDTPGISEHLGAAVAALPPVCRAAAKDVHARSGLALVEDFLSSTVDALVRRSLTDETLADSLGPRPTGAGRLEQMWLAALVGENPRIDGSLDQRTELARTVRLWLGQLEETGGHVSFRTAFRLHAPDPPPEDDRDDSDEDQVWLVTLHLQATDDPSVVLDAERVWGGGVGLTLLRRQYEAMRDQFEAELRRASHLFSALAQELETDPHPTACQIDTEGAYAFLRETAPLLELNGFAVLLPEWWNSDRPRLGLRLRLDPVQAPPVPGAQVGLDALVDYRWQAALGDETLSEDEFRILCNRGRSLIRLRGQWVETIPDAAREAWDSLNRQEGGQVTFFEALRFTVGHDTPAGLPVVGFDAGGWIGAALSGVGTEDQQIVDVPQPETFAGTMRPYQLKGVSWLAFLDRFGLGACLADDMGLGKTIQLIALLLDERHNGEDIGPTLLIVPMSLVGNWQRELRRFSPSLRAMIHHGAERLSGQAFVEQVAHHDVVISTYALAHRDFDHLDRITWHRIALDEAQNIKNPSAKQTAAVRALRTRRRLGLTGTPLENHLSELWSIMEFLNPGLLGTAADFRRDFAVPIEKHHEARRAEQLRRLIQPFVLRRRKDDPLVAVDLPEKMEMKVFCNLSREQAVLYQSVVDDMLGHIELASGIQRRGLVLSALTKLKQICNHPVAAADPKSPEARFPGDLSGRSGKCERLVEMLEEVLAEGERALVFTQFRRMGHLLETHLPQRLGCGLLYLHGGTAAKQRDEMVQRFQSDDPQVPVFLLSLKAGGFGLNLTSATHVFHFDRWWNPAVEDQATDRVHRIGQSRRVQVHKFVCAGTLEERIDKMLEEKRNLADRIIGSGERWLTELSTRDLREVLRLSQDAVAED